jgi:hypothetical protein
MDEDGVMMCDVYILLYSQIVLLIFHCHCFHVKIQSEQSHVIQAHIPIKTSCGNSMMEVPEKGRKGIRTSL